MDKRTLSRAASRVALGVTDFLGIRALPGTENYRTGPPGRPESEAADLPGPDDDEPYWMKDDFWNDSVELQSGKQKDFNHLTNPGPPAYSHNKNSDPLPSYNSHVPPTNPELDDAPPPYNVTSPETPPTYYLGSRTPSIHWFP
jgi:hypothetical protein